MLKKKPYYLFLFVTALAAGGVFLLSVAGFTRPPQMPEKGSPGMLLLEIEIPPEKDEMPPVVFPHDLHTSAMDEVCTTCHKKKEGDIVFKFQQVQETAAMAHYHDGCVGCHERQASEGKGSGPLAAQCRSCHVPKEIEEYAEKKTIFNKTLHYLHIDTSKIKGVNADQEENCSRCHHQYNKETQALFFEKGQEEACQYCHLKEGENQVKSIRQASHDSCVNCHLSFILQNEEAGPINCEECHASGIQDQIHLSGEVPRLKRGQPDVALMGRQKMDERLKKSFMKSVTFDHTLHEIKLDGCRVCHHQKLEKCSNCHELAGESTAGGSIGMEQAMHQRNSSKSCVGCHEKQKENRACVGCHFMMPKPAPDTGKCNACHNLSIPIFKSNPIEKPFYELLGDFDIQYGIINEAQIPDEVVIDELSQDYQPVVFPHRQVVQGLMKQVDSSQLARTFHKSVKSICAGCHHHQPADLTPARCAACHRKKGGGTEAIQDNRPGLKGAYHIQCMTCHQKMAVKSMPGTDCTACHDKGHGKK